MDRWMSDPAAASSGGRFLISLLGLPWHQTCPDSYTLLIDNEPLDEYLREANRATRPKDMAGPDTVERRNPRSVRLSEAGQVRHPVPEPGSRVCCARAAAHAAQSQRPLSPSLFLRKGLSESSHAARQVPEPPQRRSAAALCVLRYRRPGHLPRARLRGGDDYGRAGSAASRRGRTQRPGGSGGSAARAGASAGRG